jgi:hypothetical protein
MNAPGLLQRRPRNPHPRVTARQSQAARATPVIRALLLSCQQQLRPAATRHTHLGTYGQRPRHRVAVHHGRGKWRNAFSRHDGRGDRAAGGGARRHALCPPPHTQHPRRHVELVHSLTQRTPRTRAPRRDRLQHDLQRVRHARHHILGLSPSYQGSRHRSAQTTVCQQPDTRRDRQICSFCLHPRCSHVTSEMRGVPNALWASRGLRLSIVARSKPAALLLLLLLVGVFVCSAKPAPLPHARAGGSCVGRPRH